MIKVPEPLGPGVTFRWFVEHVVDNSPLFETSSAIAKASMLLAVDLDTVGASVEVNESALKLAREALTSEEHPLPLPQLMIAKDDAPDEQIKVPPRVYSRFIDALLEDV